MSIVSSFLTLKEQVEFISKGKSSLLVVSKNQSIENILPILETGHVLFGENRVQEAFSKWTYLKTLYPSVKLHLIGPLQTNKAKDAIKLFDVIETVDRVSLAKILAKEMQALEKRPDCYIQINVGQEPQKAGILPDSASDFIYYCCNELKLPIKGLMCIPPASEEPTPYFILLSEIAQKHCLPILSMGMSNDYNTAILQGSTHVRIGSAIFGERPKKTLLPM